MFARSSGQYKKNVAQSFFRELKNRCKAPELPPYLVSRWCHLSPSWQHGRATRWLAVKATLGTSDCQGWLSALFKNRKKFVPFETKVCIPTNLFSADTASLGENVVLLAVPWPRIIDSVRLLEVSLSDGGGCRAEC